MTKETALKTIFNQLKKQGKIISQKDLAEKTGYFESQLSQMLDGSKAMPVRFIRQLMEKFNINVNYILLEGPGEVPMFIDAEASQIKKLEQENEQLEEKIKYLLTRLDEKDELLKMYREKHGKS
jgi:transcriptional regulator with XRE-family HTH domain